MTDTPSPLHDPHPTPRDLQPRLTITNPSTETRSKRETASLIGSQRQLRDGVYPYPYLRATRRIVVTGGDIGESNGKSKLGSGAEGRSEPRWVRPCRRPFLFVEANEVIRQSGATGKKTERRVNLVPLKPHTRPRVDG
jgi:hypothetical protein